MPGGTRPGGERWAGSAGLFETARRGVRSQETIRRSDSGAAKSHCDRTARSESPCRTRACVSGEKGLRERGAGIERGDEGESHVAGRAERPLCGRIPEQELRGGG